MRIVRLSTAALIVFASSAAMAAGPFDGVYKGGSTGTGSGRCQPGNTFDITVRDSEFNWRSSGEVQKVRVLPDGSFAAQGGGRTLNGRIAGSTMSASLLAAVCTYSWSLTK